MDTDEGANTPLVEWVGPRVGSTPMRPGLEQEACAGCGAAVWVNPAVRAGHPDARLICETCSVLEDGLEAHGWQDAG
jgi:hypothetical protein